VFPNPNNNGIFHATFPKDIDETVEIHVYDMLGNEVRIITNQNLPKTIDFSLIDPAVGSYLMHIESRVYRFIELIQIN